MAVSADLSDALSRFCAASSLSFCTRTVISSIQFKHACSISASVPSVFEGSFKPQCTFRLLPKYTGHVSPAAASQTVITKSGCKSSKSCKDWLTKQSVEKPTWAEY